MRGASGPRNCCEQKVAPFKASLIRPPSEQAGSQGADGVGFVSCGTTNFVCRDCLPKLKEGIAEATECFWCGRRWNDPNSAPSTASSQEVSTDCEATKRQTFWSWVKSLFEPPPLPLDDRIRSALKSWYRQKAQAWWSGTSRGEGVCDDCNGEIRRGQGFLRPGNYLACEEWFFGSSY